MVRTQTARHGWRNAQLRGALGDVACDQDGNCFDTATGESLTTSTDIPGGYGTPILSAPTPAQIAASTAIFAPPTTSAIPSTPAPGSSSGSIFATLANDLTSLAAPIVKSATTPAPYYITNAQGQQVLYNPATGQVVSRLSASLGSINPMYLLLGLGLLAALAFGKK